MCTRIPCMLYQYIHSRLPVVHSSTVTTYSKKHVQIKCTCVSLIVITSIISVCVYQ